MIGYTLKSVLELVPEALDLVKKASIEQEWPTASKDDCIASALSLVYHRDISGKSVNYDAIEKVAQATQAFGVESTVNELASKMVSRNRNVLEKAASSETSASYLEKQAHWEGELTGMVDLEKVASKAEDLAEIAKQVNVDPSEKVKLYSGDAYIYKEAALDALGSRFYVTKNDIFVKIAAALSKEAEFIPPGPLVRNLCSTVSRLDKQAGLSAKGFNFYKEALITKSAAVSSMTANVAGKSYPIAKIASIPSQYLDDYLGADFTKELNSDPASAKAMIESLPMDSQHVLATILKNAG